jgi:alkanesulfonate monooxygenase SsuD/methylene tetrahydromethanopterin reductase-like flavin-dependent oxidoreductase (luciferase family)
MPYLVRPERLRQSLSALDAIAEDAGRDLRDFAVVDFVMVAVDDNAARAHNGAASFVRDAFGERTDRDPAQLVGEVVLAGTTEQVDDGLATHFAAGATEIILCPIHGDRSETAAELNRRLRPEAASWDATDPLPRMGEPT